MDNIKDPLFEQSVEYYGASTALNIQRAMEKWKFIKLGEDGIVEIYADNYMLSSLRKCEGYFQEGILNKIGSKGRIWSLDFGIYLHAALEIFYAHHNSDWFGADLNVFLAECKQLWDKLKLDELQGQPQFTKLGGWPGAALLLSEYFTVYRNDRLRIVGSELGFGKSKEVPIIKNERKLFRAYYCGRLDYIVDTGAYLGPMDTKSTSRFDGSEKDDFKPHDGMEGYVYSCRQLMPEEFKSIGRLPTTVIINHISLQACKNPFDRFKRSFISFTPEELEAWRLRQVTTFTKLFEIVVDGRPVDWNTELCTQFYFRDCPFKQLHETSPSSREGILKTFYQIGKEWSPYDQEEKQGASQNE